ncbi:hypothetical protein P3632_21990 [Vibrio parahaemolyticus]|uniref:Uncharacterized protein n=1 Tax=Vibrio parahaemolyticus TaxID=670 RepID=A0A7Y0XCN6_VIBPH|nr:hypothetical protein [Vibrio parahaemolyticus]MDF5045566.1 hypothetical protein [Vibrio parahaemolyticus]MDF5234471.1 hypothetical protein [Vibrio parahaemolyticus]MDF5243714.1 hypothetical protein [Vibrio parahaemolyticus]MDF5256990.1 hypothetical protein [Vibrio parahaemolyticus]MDF5276075.1 hypothetical protein [Vibrio parahaemolyticus]
MTITTNRISDQERQASRVIKRLRHYGCKVVVALKTPRGVIINIEQPTPEMKARAIEIKQTLNGVYSTVYTMQFDGCTVNWKQGDVPCLLH